MSRRFCGFGLMMLAACFTALGDDKHHEAPASASNPGFEKMKTLVGTWVVADENGKPTDQVASIVRLTAGGSAIHETHFPGQDMEMISVYTAEGHEVVMTHYCMLGNQPRLKADGRSGSNQLQFEFNGGGNLDPKKDKHMHSGTITFVDSDTIQIEGVAWDKGEPCKEMCGTQKLVRKK